MDMLALVGSSCRESSRFCDDAVISALLRVCYTRSRAILNFRMFVWSLEAKKLPR